MSAYDTRAAKCFANEEQQNFRSGMAIHWLGFRWIHPNGVGPSSPFELVSMEARLIG